MKGLSEEKRTRYREKLAQILEGEQIELTESQDAAIKKFTTTNKNLFISGSAGTGKSFIISLLRRLDDCVIAAPTGIAALNAGGTTLHRLFRLPTGLLVQTHDTDYTNAKLAELLQHINTLIIDEISMVRADAFDAIDRRLRYAKDQRRPFGGARVIVIGDFFQLPPVIVPREKRVFFNYYDTPFAFSSESWDKLNFSVLNLLEAKRQNQSQAKVLNRMRRGEFIQDGVDMLGLINKISMNDEKRQLLSDAPILALTNARVDEINQVQLAKLPGIEYECVGEKHGKTHELPVPEFLRLKVDARVLILKNNGNEYVNGDVGVIVDINEETNTILIQLNRDKRIVQITRHTWEYIKYVSVKSEHGGSSKIQKVIEGTYTQFPVKLGWACTVHKSQGMTLDEFTLDLERSTFAHGQAYVGISRIRDLSNLSLERAIRPSDFIIDENVNKFYEANGLS